MMEDNLPEVIEKTKSKNRHKNIFLVSTGISFSKPFKYGETYINTVKIGVSNDKDGKIIIASAHTNDFGWSNKEFHLTVDEAKALRHNLDKAIRKAVING